VVVVIKSHIRKGKVVRSHKRSVSSYPSAPSSSSKDIKPNTYYKSNKTGKKLMIKVEKGGKKKLIHFGDSSMSDFTKHKDPERRKNYLSRSGGIRNKSGQLTKNDPFSANYHARRKLW